MEVSTLSYSSTRRPSGWLPILYSPYSPDLPVTLACPEGGARQHFPFRGEEGAVRFYLVGDAIRVSGPEWLSAKAGATRRG
jgi:hypothetical protein